MKRFWILVALAATAAAAQLDTCMEGCKCSEDMQFSRRMRILDCDAPLLLNNSTLAKVPKKLNTISFENCIIVKISQDAFQKFSDLDTILFRESIIGNIDSTAFDLPELGKVSFIGVAFEEVPALKSDYLEELVFSDCELSDIPKVSQLSALSLLSVPNNEIKRIAEDAFSLLENLEELNLSNNSISALPVNVFDNNSELNTLTLDHNPLKVFRLDNTLSLELLSLKSCQLTVFDENSSKNLEQVSQLNLSNNNISVLPIDAFDTMKELLVIDLSNNNLVEMSDDIFEANTKLNKIVLDNNPFLHLPKFVGPQSFQTVYFSCNNCSLTSLTNVFDNMPGIVTLQLENNQISNIEHVFEKVHSIKDLNLANNKISKVVASAFASNAALESWNLAGNPLKPLDPVVLAGLTSLRKLDVTNTNLTQLWSNYNSILPSLEQLLIGKNKLTSLTLPDLNVTPNVKMLDISENPLSCSDDFHDAILALRKRLVYQTQGGKTHESMNLPDLDAFEDNRKITAWKQLYYEICADMSAFEEDYKEFDDIEKNTGTEADPVDITKYDTKYDEDFYDTYYYYNDDDDDSDSTKSSILDFDRDTVKLDEALLDEQNLSLTRASYILSITSVFILTAFVVLTLAVTVTLCILKKRRAFNMHEGNLPRLKIPLWSSTPGQKKHSGSVYRPLSEDLSGSRTPIINRYEFKPTAIVHNSVP